ncbi:MAG TPA: sn-glycerol-3-phosphate ABC transporter ATP-binding protein UgpC [Patescibacteria group bacterium]|nr:sn-glycerol-3-phosphate ABC transporter ATP-binding protein UgpC [Patescibacteria group bacterium]
MAQVQFIDVEKIFDGNVVAATDINLTIEDRELLVLVGPSGCGKSTVLRMVAGLEQATSGEILFDGKPVNDLPPKDRNVAMVFQNYALYPHMSVYDNMAFGLKIRKFPKEETRARVDEAADLLGISALLGRKPKALSGGQRQRVALGRAIVRKPSVFLFDEPLSNLDAKMRVQMRVEIRKLNLEIQTTMIYVTHDQVEAMTLGDRLAVMNEGRILQVGTPLDLYDRPTGTFVGSFIGSPAMNFIEGTLGDGEGAAIQTSFTSIPVPDRFRDALARGVPAGGGRKVTIGIRPEDIYLGATAGDGARFHSCGASIDVTESLGNEIIFHLRCGELPLVARDSTDRKGSPGENVTISIDLEKMHLFDGESGKSLLP